MSKVIDFPKTPQTETIDQAFFEKFADAALLLKCFECVKDAVEAVDGGGVIESRDDTYISLIESYWALKVLFERKTGSDAKKVSDEHWDIASKCLLAGREPPDMNIPIAEAMIAPFRPEYFDQASNLELACAAFNFSDAVRLSINSLLVANNAQNTANAAVEAINSTTALHQLVLRLSGGSLEAMAAQISRKPGETLQ
ncbi:hypothetical protein POF45_22030 [Pseudomonas sp. 681]|uniref:DUF416 family protein n=1 Tax=Pseudomonas fungipugnans TaxID=3024217 RepID=A0ABT6QT48_9PSED|nr:hypothetical protein [Pseudomonas sp. 681]MDI2594087.1 hypothetical protein [Pseudomonas sp. 681]